MVGGDSQDRPCDVYSLDFSDLRTTYFDVSQVNTLLAGIISISSVAAGEVASEGEKLKDAKHAEVKERVGGVFVPFVAETLGVWSPLGLNILKQIAAQSTLCNALDANVVTKHLLQQLFQLSSGRITLSYFYTFFYSS